MFSLRTFCPDCYVCPPRDSVVCRSDIIYKPLQDNSKCVPGMISLSSPILPSCLRLCFYKYIYICCILTVWYTSIDVLCFFLVLSSSVSPVSCLFCLVRVVRLVLFSLVFSLAPGIFFFFFFRFIVFYPVFLLLWYWILHSVPPLWCSGMLFSRI